MSTQILPTKTFIFKMPLDILQGLYREINDINYKKDTEQTVLDVYNMQFNVNEKVFCNFHIFQIKYELEEEILKRLLEGKIKLVKVEQNDKRI